MRIVDLYPAGPEVHRQTATLLVREFAADFPTAWPTYDDAWAEVVAFFTPERVARVALDSTDQVIGWIGGLPRYKGRAWELHPLVVRSDRQGRGIGRALVADLEERVRERGAFTLWLGSDDENCRTSLGGIDLYPNVLEHALRIRNLRGHPYEFYQRLGFVIVGVMPDVNGPGKPDIYMAKRVRGAPAADGMCDPAG